MSKHSSKSITKLVKICSTNDIENESDENDESDNIDDLIETLENETKEDDFQLALEINKEANKIYSYEELLDRYKDNNELSKFTSFDESDFYNIESCPIMLTLLKILNETVFITQKILIPSEVKSVFGNVLGIFNFEFCNYLIVHKNRDLIFKLKLEKLLKAKSLIDLKRLAKELSMFLSYEYDSNELENAISKKEFIKLESLKNSIKNDFENFYGLSLTTFSNDNDSTQQTSKDNAPNTSIINSLNEFICCSDTLYYEGSFLMNAKRIYDELFVNYPVKLNARQKFTLLLNMYNKNVEGISFENIKVELMNQLQVYVKLIFKDSTPNIILTDNFWNDITNIIICFLIQFAKEISIEAIYNAKNTKLRIKAINILDIMRGLCPRDRVYTISQINFIKYISNTKVNLKTTLSKKYGYITKTDEI